MRHHRAGWIPLIIIAWNSFDILLHVLIGMIEPLRVSGNVIAIVAVIILLLGYAERLESTVLVMSAVAVVAVNGIFSLQNGFEIPMLILIWVSLYFQIRWAQIESAATSSQTHNFYYRYWFSALTALVGVLVIVFSGLALGI